MHHSGEEIGDFAELDAASDIFGGLEASTGDEIEGGAAGGGGVMEAGLEGDVTVVEAIGIEADDGAGGRAAEEVN